MQKYNSTITPHSQFLDNDKSVIFGKSVRHSLTHKNNNLTPENDKYGVISNFVRGDTAFCRIRAGNVNS
ncbi:hypothetical protein KJ564_08475, partial [bacterium]|nr:hypothetical protein [bacterium]